jgi:serine/threonine-protein kinase
MLTGRYPFGGGTDDVIQGHIREVPDRPSRLVTGIPQALDAIVLKILQKDPAERYLDAYHVIRDLNELGIGLEEDVIQPRDSTPEVPDRRTYPPGSARMERGAGPWTRFVEEVQKSASTPEERNKAEAMAALTEQLDGIDRRMEDMSFNLESLDREMRQARQNIGRALDELARDQSVRNAGLLRSSARVADLHNGLESTSQRALEILSNTVQPEFGANQPALNRRVAEGLVDLGRVAERWMQYREQADRERNTKRQHISEVRDIEFQLKELRDRLEKVNDETEAALNDHRRQLEKYGRRRLILLDDLAELASAFSHKVELPV